MVLLFAAFIGLSALGVYRGVDRAGIPQGLIAQHLLAFYTVGLFVFAAVGGTAVQMFQRR